MSRKFWLASAGAWLTLTAFGLRVYHLGRPPLLWDEGWSIGLSRLPLGEIARITALDVHPPLYYVLLKVWLTLGAHEFVTRFLSVLTGVVMVPLGYQVGRRWRGRRVGFLAALYLVAAPPLIYYSQITRMFTVSVACLLLATYGLLGWVRARPGADSLSRTDGLAFVIGSLGALYSFYYTAFVLAGLFVYALLAAPNRWKRTVLAFTSVAVLYLPWVAYATPAMLNRVGSRTGFEFSLAQAFGLTTDAFYGLIFPYGVGWPAVYVVLAVVAVGVLVGALRQAQGDSRQLGRWVWLPVLAVGLTLFGAALGAQAHMFAARYTIVASPFVALALAAALALTAPAPSRTASAQRWGWGGWWLFGLAAALVLLTTLPTITDYVYAKSYEVFDPFDPSADWRTLHEVADGDDVVFFNVLSLAGTYERYRRPQDPGWSYALRWDPVVESMSAATRRIDEAARSHDRLWFVLYKGTVAANADLKAWLDDRFYPAAAPGWRDDTLYVAYIDPQGPWRDVALDADYGAARLTAARFTQPGAEPDCPRCGVVGLDLVWQAAGGEEVGADRTAGVDAKVFVHLYDAGGNLIAQHDSIPALGSRPLSTWQPRETIVDRHGLAVPDRALRPLALRVGLYDAKTGERLHTEDGRDIVDVAVFDTYGGGKR